MPERKINEIVSLISSSLGAIPGQQFELHEPFFDELEKKYLNDCIDTRWVSYQGPYVKRFEELLASRCNVKHAISVSSGTVALFLALYVTGIGHGDEVILPSMTFVATANAIVHTGAAPHFVEVSRSNLGIDAEKLEVYLNNIISFDAEGNAINKNTSRRVKAIIPVHIFGHPVDLDGILAVAKKYKLLVIEDAAEAIGCYYHGKHVGSHGVLSILSFNGNKTITTGGGGAIITNDDRLADSIKYLSTTAKRPHKYDFFHDQVGFNFRMPNINAAIGVAQLEKLDKFLHNKRKLAQHYNKVFKDNPYFEFLLDEEHTSSNYWLNAIILKTEFKAFRDSILEALHAVGIKCRPLWCPMHLLPMYLDCPKDNLSSTEDLAQRIICLPSSANIMESI